MCKRWFQSALVIALAMSTTAMAIDIAISTKSGWWGQADADREMQDIANNVRGATVELFTVADLDALANWIADHTGNGAPDLLIMCGNFPDTIYPAGNAEPDGSLAELFLDDGNTIVNTGDYIFYVGTAANNDAGGLENMMDIPGIGMWGDDAVPCVPTAEGQEITPSLVEIASTRPFFYEQLANDWYPELILGQTAAGDRGDPVIVRNSVTGGRLGIFFQVANAHPDIRGEVISEWINNWYLGVAGDAGASAKPVPANEAIDIPHDDDLSWVAGEFATTHNVYFGTDWQDVNDGTGDTITSMGQTDTSFDPGRLAYDQTYYWRVDEVNSAPDFTVFLGKIWSFTVEPKAIPIADITATASSANTNMGPENTINGSGLDAMDQHGLQAQDMWLATEGTPWIQYDFDAVYKLHELRVWNSNQAIEAFIGFGIKEATMEYSVDGENWSTLDAPITLSRAPGAPTYQGDSVALGGIMAKYVKLTVISAHGFTPQTGLAEVRFMALPVNARTPQPADDSTTDAVDVQLSWRSGREAATHEVALSTDLDAVVNGTAPVSASDEASFDAGTLNFGTTYNWQVVEVNDTAVPSAHAGDIWSFTTPDFESIDDFESYSADVDQEIYLAWWDGFGGDPALGGSTTGHIDAPFVETSVVNSGRQSMPFFYDNDGGFFNIDGQTSAPTYSEVEREFNPVQDWTKGNAEMLSLFFQGDAVTAANVAQPLYIRVEDSSGKQVVITHQNPDAVLATTWKRWNILLSDLAPVNLDRIKKLTIGVGYPTGGGVGGSGLIFIDDIRLGKIVVTLPPAITTPGDAVLGVPNDGDWPGGETPDLAIDNDASTKFLHFKGETEATGLQITPAIGATVVKGLTLTTANDAAERDPVAFEIYGSNVGIDGPYILIAAGDIADFNQGTAWDRFRTNETPIWFENYTTYEHYQVLFTAVRDAGGANSMQIAEVQLNGVIAPLPPDVTKPGDTTLGVPNDDDWPLAEAPQFVIDNDSGTKYLHFKGEEGITGFWVTPSVGATVVTGLTFTTANDADGRDPISYELSGSNVDFGGPYTVIAAGDIADFNQATAWPRLTANETPIGFVNSVAYKHYQLIFTAIRGTDIMQIAEVELNGVTP